MNFRARMVLPISQPPIDDGVICVSEGHITDVGRWKHLRKECNGETVDLGEVLVMPGLVNAHCHLDYTDMRGQISSPRSFADWIKALVALKAEWTYSDYAQSWLHGARMLIDRGVTLVADIESVPELLPEVWTATPLRVLSFLEMTGVKSRRPARSIVREALERIDSLPTDAGKVGISPHAPYSTTLELVSLAARAARRRQLRVTTHVAESSDEFDMFMHRRGPLFDWLKKQRGVSDCGQVSPVQHLERCGLLAKNLLAVHVNYLGPGDAELLGRRGVSVVHCPRSHHYFQHVRFPWEELTKAGVNICLGTDSLVSVVPVRRQKPDLDMFVEMRRFLAATSSVGPETIVRMATLNAARALGLEGLVGELVPGAFGDFIVLPLSNASKDHYESVVNFAGDVAGSMIDGRWAVQREFLR